MSAQEPHLIHEMGTPQGRRGVPFFSAQSLAFSVGVCTQARATSAPRSTIWRENSAVHVMPIKSPWARAGGASEHLIAGGDLHAAVRALNQRPVIFANTDAVPW